MPLLREEMLINRSFPLNIPDAFRRFSLTVPVNYSYSFVERGTKNIKQRPGRGSYPEASTLTVKITRL